MSWARVGIFLGQAARERKRLHNVATALGLPVFGSDTLRTLRTIKPDATTAFILGTGASAADLSDQKLDYIKSQFSIGVNQWIFHPLIPDVYAYEVDPDLRLLKALDRPEVRNKAPHLLFLKPSRPEDFLTAWNLPESIREKSFLYSRVNVWTRKTSNLTRDFLNVSKICSRMPRPDVLLDNGASIARLIALCVQLGFKRIVLVGVDLGNVEYFWHRRPDFLEPFGMRNFPTAQVAESHETLSAVNRPFGIDTYVFEIARLHVSSVGFEILVESPLSNLAKELEVWGLT